VWCLTPVILSVWGEEIREWQFPNQPELVKKVSKTLFLLFFIHLFTCAYTGLFSLSATPPPPSAPHPPHFQAESVLPLSLILLKRRHKHSKKDKAFLLLEIGIAIEFPSIASMYKCVTTQVDSSLTDL
jgi:hypothetical protein